MADVMQSGAGSGPKIVVIGCGAVGSTFAYTAVLRGLAGELVLMDATRAKAEGDALDLNHGLPFVPPVRISAGDYDDVSGADIVVIAAGAGQKPGETRLDLVKKNAAIFREIIPRVAERAPRAILLVATNPVDVLSYLTYRLSGFPASRVIGSGTLLDSARFRYLIGQAASIDPRSVHAYIIGEHGDSELPVWSRSNIAGVSLTEPSPYWPLTGDKAQRDRLFEETRDAAYRIIERKGATYYAIALALARIVEAVLRDENAVLTVSTLLQDFHGISDLYLGVPAVVGRSGVRQVIQPTLDEGEKERLRHSADVLRRTVDSLL